MPSYVTDDDFKDAIELMKKLSRNDCRVTKKICLWFSFKD